MKAKFNVSMGSVEVVPKQESVKLEQEQVSSENSLDNDKYRTNRYCVNCGKAISKTAKFFKYCGEKIDEG